MKFAVKMSAAVLLLSGVGGLLVAYAMSRTAAPAGVRTARPTVLEVLVLDKPQSAAFSPTLSATNPVTDSVKVLDERRQFALGMIETGNHDGDIGGAGEVSRYQIMPAVWRRYSDSRNYYDPEVSVVVARQHWSALYSTFKRQARREPTDFDMYVLWNTHSGYYSARNFDPARIAPVVRDRAQRYVNLVEYGQNS